MKDYKVYVTPACFKEIKPLPGHIQQNVRNAISDLADDYSDLEELIEDIE